MESPLHRYFMCYQQSCCADQKYCWPYVLFVLSELTVCMSVAVVHIVGLKLVQDHASKYDASSYTQ